MKLRKLFIETEKQTIWVLIETQKKKDHSWEEKTKTLGCSFKMLWYIWTLILVDKETCDIINLEYGKRSKIQI